MNKELTPLEALSIMHFNCREYDNLDKHYDVIEKSIKDCENLKSAINDLANNHIELVKTKGGFYFKIKNSKGKEKSWTSLIDFWKQWFEIKENQNE